MKRDLTGLKKSISLLFLSVLLLCTKSLFAQDSTGSGQAKIIISFAEKDSVKQVTAKLTNGDTVVKGIDIHFYVKKSFGLLPLEGTSTTTDENGEASVDFPTDLPGDVSGNVVVVARVEDDDKLGNVEATKPINWGVPAKVESTVPARALWSSGNNAPWPLTITVISIVAVVWGIIFYMLYQLVSIKKEGRYKIEKDT
jgi:hypothetical protein